MEFLDSMLLQGIEKADYEKMQQCLRTVTKSYKQGEIIYSFDSREKEIGLLEGGEAYLERVDIEGNKTMLDCLEVGSVFGTAIAFANEKEEDYSVICTKDAVVTYIPYEHITRQCEKVCLCHRKLIENMMHIFAEKAREFGERIEVISNRSIRGKLLYYLHIQAQRQNSHIIMLPFSVTTLAEYLCVDRSALTREISNMKKEGLIHMERRKVTLNS